MSQTSSFTIIYTAILSPIILKETFILRRDGVTIMIIAVGSYAAISQTPKQEESFTRENVIDNQL
jgi:hypothetical protein